MYCSTIILVWAFPPLAFTMQQLDANMPQPPLRSGNTAGNSSGAAEPNGRWVSLTGGPAKEAAAPTGLKLGVNPKPKAAGMSADSAIGKATSNATGKEQPKALVSKTPGTGNAAKPAAAKAAAPLQPQSQAACQAAGNASCNVASKATAKDAKAAAPKTPDAGKAATSATAKAAPPSQLQPKAKSEAGGMVVKATSIGITTVNKTAKAAVAATSAQTLKKAADNTTAEVVQARKLTDSILKETAPKSVRGKYASETSLKCSTTRSNGHVHHITDGEGNERCFVLILPVSNPGPVPVFFWFHASGGSAKDCGELTDDTNTLIDVAEKAGVALACGEALQDYFGSGGQWAIPSHQTAQSGTRCNETESFDIGYVHNIMEELTSSHPNVDLSSLYFGGISMGGAFSQYISFCSQKELGASRVSAFISHSSGIKVKGDGLAFPADIWHPEYSWGECDGCQYFPFVPEPTSGSLKACLFDNENDPSSDDPFFRTSTNNLATKWTELGNKAEVHIGTGGHMTIHSFADIFKCLDDSSSKLVSANLLRSSAFARVGATLAVAVAIASAAFAL